MTACAGFTWARTSACSFWRSSGTLQTPDETLPAVPAVAAPHADAAAAAVDPAAAALHRRAQPGDRPHPDGQPRARARGPRGRGRRAARERRRGPGDPGKEPGAVGARSPGECLCLQLKTMEKDAVRDLALEIAGKHLELLAGRDYTRLKSSTGASDDALRAAQRLILALNPRPGAAFAKLEARYVVPDVIVRKSRNAWRATLNAEAMPRLRINRLYAELAAAARTGGAGGSSRLQQEEWLINHGLQPFRSILRVSPALPPPLPH